MKPDPEKAKRVLEAASAGLYDPDVSKTDLLLPGRE